MTAHIFCSFFRNRPNICYRTRPNLLDTISDFALQHEKEIIKKLPALKDDPAWSKAIDWGEETDASKVDEYLYN